MNTQITFLQLCPSRSLRFVWSLNWACRRQFSSIGQLHDNDWLQLPEFGFALLFKFVNPAEEWRTIALICTRKQQTQGQSGSCSKMTSSCNCPTHQGEINGILETHLNDTQRPEKNSTKKKNAKKAGKIEDSRKKAQNSTIFPRRSNNGRQENKYKIKLNFAGRERSVTTENERQKFVFEIPDKGLHTRHSLVI